MMKRQRILYAKSWVLAIPTMLAVASSHVNASPPVDADASDVRSCKPLGEVLGETAICIAGGKKRAVASALKQAEGLGATHIVMVDVRCHIGVGHKARARVFDCAAGVSLDEVYEDYLQRDATLASRTVAASGEADIRKSRDLDADAGDLATTGFVLIGYAGYSGALARLEDVQRKAKEVGASWVLLQSTFEGNDTEYQSMISYSQAGPTVSFVDGNISGTSGSAGFSGSSLTMQGQSTSQEFVPFQQRRYESQLLFWRKGVAGPLGIHGGLIPPRMRSVLQRNTGVYIVGVEENSPAFFGNLLAGDVVIGVNGAEVRVLDDLKRIIAQAAGKPLEVEYLRGAEQRKVSIQAR